MLGNMISTESPYHLPLCEKGGICKKPDKLVKSQKTDPNTNPWQRLSSTTTCSKKVKEVSYCGPQGPQDRLEFLLRSEYDHHRELFKGNNEMCIQKETILRTMGRFRCCWADCEESRDHGLRIVGLCEKLSPYSVKTIIHSHHLQTSNNGYSRKPDGGFYSS